MDKFLDLLGLERRRSLTKGLIPCSASLAFYCVFKCLLNQCVLNPQLQKERRLMFMVRRSFCELSRSTVPYRNGNPRPTIEGWQKPTGEVTTPCKTPSSRAIWGKASPAQPHLAGMQTPPSWPHTALQNFQRLALPHLTSSHPEPGHNGIRTAYCKDQEPFEAGAVPSQFGWWNNGTDCQHIESCHSNYLTWTVKLDRKCSKIYPAAVL